MEILAIQASYFLHSIDLTNKLKLANNIADSMGDNIFNGNSTILPIPNDAPPEIPRILLTNLNDSLKLNISPIRIDFNYNVKLDTSDEDSNKKFERLNEIIFSKVEEISTGIKRIALVETYTEMLTDNNLSPVVKNNVNDSFLNDTVTKVLIHKLEEKEFLDFKINHWIRLESSKDELKMILDINTTHTQDYEIKFAQHKNFYPEASKLNKSVIDELV